MDQKQEAKRLFNETWNYLDMLERSKDDNIQMLHMAHTSCFLFQGVGTPVHLARGEWQVSRVYSVLDMGEPALLHGEKSLQICLDNGIEGIDLVFGYEAVARAYSVLNAQTQAEEYCQMGILAAPGILDEDDRQYALREIESVL